MAGLKMDFPLINKVFQKFAVLPATQNADERLFSMVGRMTGPQCRRIKATTIEKKVIVGAAVQKHGFIFKYTEGNDSNTSDEQDSFWVCDECLDTFFYWQKNLLHKMLNVSN